MAEAQQPRQEIPGLVETNDLIEHIGVLTVDILNRSKVIKDLWRNIDELVDKEAKAGASLVEQEAKIVNLKQQVEALKTKVDSNAKKLEEKRLEFQSELNLMQEDLNKSNSHVSSMEKEVQAIEAKAVINQESFRQVAQGEVAVLEKKLKNLQVKLDKATVQPMAKRAGYKKKRKALDG